MNSAFHSPNGRIARDRKDGYAVTERTKAFADILHKVGDRLDAGESPDDWGCWVQCIGKAMGR